MSAITPAINLDHITYGFRFIVTMKVKNKKTNKVWRQHQDAQIATNSQSAIDQAKACLKKHIEFIELVSIRCTGELCFAYYHDMEGYPSVSDDKRKLIPVPTV